MNLEHINNMIRHYDNLLWTVSSILLATNGVLINALIKTENFGLRLVIAFIGYFLTIFTVYFAASFRKLRHGYVNKFYKDLNNTTEESDIKTIHGNAKKTMVTIYERYNC